MKNKHLYWEWYLLKDGTIELYYKKVLALEFEGFENANPRAVNLFVMEYIMQYQYYLLND